MLLDLLVLLAQRSLLSQQRADALKQCAEVRARDEEPCRAVEGDKAVAAVVIVKLEHDGLEFIRIAVEGKAQEHAHVRLLLAAAVAREHFIEPVEDRLKLCLLAVKQPYGLAVRARALRKRDGITGQVDIYGVNSAPIHVKDLVRLERFVRRM